MNSPVRLVDERRRVLNIRIKSLKLGYSLFSSPPTTTVTTTDSFVWILCANDPGPFISTFGASACSSSASVSEIELTPVLRSSSPTLIFDELVRCFVARMIIPLKGCPARVLVCPRISLKGISTSPKLNHNQSRTLRVTRRALM